MRPFCTQAYAMRKIELNLAYAKAMRNVSREFPDHHHVQTLFADALM